MTDRLTCFDMEMFCRHRAVLDSADRGKWLKEAERWRSFAHQQTAAEFQQMQPSGRMWSWPSTLIVEQESAAP
jgi:hypothetical protein